MCKTNDTSAIPRNIWKKFCDFVHQHFEHLVASQILYPRHDLRARVIVCLCVCVCVCARARAFGRVLICVQRAHKEKL